MDARLCIAYLTIEHKGVIPRELRPKIKDWLFGCDECLSVCPFTARSQLSGWKEFRSGAGAGASVRLESLLEIRSNAEYERRFQGTALLRTNRKQLLRNACIVLGNSGSPRAVGGLAMALDDSS